jgi:hypothetical protein
VPAFVALLVLGTGVAVGEHDGGEARHPAKLEVARNTIDRGDRRLDVLAPITRRASGEVEVELHAAGRRYRFDADVNSEEGYVRFRKRIPRAQARLGTGIATITYPGNGRTRGQEVRLRAAHGKARLDAKRPELALSGGQLRLRSQGTLSKRARGVVRVQLDWVDAGGDDQSYETNAKIDDGEWELSGALPATVRQSIDGRTSTVHSYTLFTGYFEARIRGEMEAYQVLAAPELSDAATGPGLVSPPASSAPPTAPPSGSPTAPPSGSPTAPPSGSPTAPPSGSPTAPPPPSPPPSTLGSGQTLQPGSRLESPNGAYRLVMQGDGNLVLYKGSSALWSSATGAAGSRAVMQGDGNLVVYSGSTAKWSSQTDQYTGATLSVQDDGNLVIYDNGRAIWTRSTGYIGAFLKSGQTLMSGELARSDNKSFRLIMQSDGNLVLYKGSSALWSSATGAAGSRAVMQGDGNLVVYSGSTAKWSSETAGNAGAYLAVQNDGNLVIYRGSRAIWTRHNTALKLPWPAGQTHRINSAGSGYGCDFHVGRTQYAIDFDHAAGQAVSSVAEGAARAGYHDQLGKYVWIDHGGGLVSIYAHFSSFSGSFPRAVAQGEVIGAAGNTGASRGAHLHFVMRSGATGPFDGQAFKPEPMSGYSGFGAYGCGRGTSPPYTP